MVCCQHVALEYRGLMNLMALKYFLQKQQIIPFVQKYVAERMLQNHDVSMCLKPRAVNAGF